MAGGITPRAPKVPGATRVPRGSDDDDDDDDDDDEQKRFSKLLGELRTDEGNEEFRNEPKEDKLDKFVNNMPNLETEKEATLNKFKEMVRNKEDEIDKALEDKENRLNKLNNNVKKIKDYTKENNNKLNTIKHKLDYTENERNQLLLDRNQLYGKLKGTENELYETKKRLDEARDDTNEKTKYIDKLKEIHKKHDYQNNKLKELNSELNEKNETIKNLENKKIEIINKNNEISKKYSEINKELTKEVRELKKKLIQNKKILDYYEKNKITMRKNISELEEALYRLNNENEEILNRLKKEYKESSLKDTKLNVYLEENKTMKQKLEDNNNKISKLKKSKNLLIKGLNKQKRINESETKENDELKDEIKKLEKSKIELGGLPKLLKDNEALPDEDKKSFKNLKSKLILKSIEIPEDFDSNKYFRDEESEYLDINLGDVDNLVGEIKQNVKNIDNIIDINFNDIINFSEDIVDGKINNFNKEKKYNEKFKNIEKNLENRTKYNNTIRLYIIYLNQLKNILFTLKKSSGKGLTISDLPILLSKIYTNNNSKEMINEITQLTKKLYDNKQITKQLYNILNKALQ